MNILRRLNKMTLKGYKQGSSKKIVLDAYEKGITIQELCRITGKSYYSIKSCETRCNIKLKSESGRGKWGGLKQEITKQNYWDINVAEAAIKFNTTIASVYSLATRHNIEFRKAEYGEMRAWKEFFSEKKEIANKKKLT